MIGKIWYLFLCSFLVFASLTFAREADDQRDDYLLSNYYQFAQAFEENNKEQLKVFLNGQSKFGQEIGGQVTEILQYVSDNNSCRERLLNVLYEGCKRYTEGESHGCIAPPQAADNSVIYVGPRIAFTSDSSGKTFMLQFLNCGSD